MKRALKDIILEDIRIDNRFVIKHQKQLIENITKVLRKSGAKLFSGSDDTEEHQKPINRHLKRWLQEMDRSDTVPTTKDPLLDRMKTELANTESEIVEVRETLKSENKEIIKQFKTQIWAMIQERKSDYEYAIAYSNQFSAIVEMIMALKVDSILSQPYIEAPNWLYGTYIFLQGGMPYYASILSTAIAFQVLLLEFLLGHLLIYKIYQAPRSFDEGTLMPDNLLDLLYIKVKNLQLETVISDVVYSLYQILPTPNKVDRITSNIIDIMNKNSFSDEIEEKVSASILLYYLIYLVAFSGSIFDMLCFSIINSREFNNFTNYTHTKYNIKVSNVIAYLSSDLHKALNIITEMRLPVYSRNPEEFKRILDTIKNGALAQFMYDNIDYLMKIYADYHKGAISLVKNELKNRYDYEASLEIVSNPSLNLSSAADYYRILDEIERILSDPEDKGVSHLYLNYAIPFFNFEPEMLELNNRYIKDTYLTLSANLDLNLNIDYRRFLG